MDRRTNFERHKIERAIKVSGDFFQFYRPALNEFNEPTEKQQFVATIYGIYHTSTSHLSVTDSDAGSTVNLKMYTPAILCTTDEALQLQKDDLVTIGDKLCRVNGVVTFQEKGYAYDIQCEVIEDGRKRI